MNTRIIIFDDGETWALADSAKVAEVTPEQYRQLADGVYPRHMHLRAQPLIERTSRWDLLAKTSPSGKSLFRCNECGRESTTPDKTCPASMHVCKE
jgi:hypothetical protein